MIIENEDTSVLVIKESELEKMKSYWLNNDNTEHTTCWVNKSMLFSDAENKR